MSSVHALSLFVAPQLSVLIVVTHVPFTLPLLQVHEDGDAEDLEEHEMVEALAEGKRATAKEGKGKGKGKAVTSDGDGDSDGDSASAAATNKYGAKKTNNKINTKKKTKGAAKGAAKGKGAGKAEAKKLLTAAEEEALEKMRQHYAAIDEYSLNFSDSDSN